MTYDSTEAFEIKKERMWDSVYGRRANDVAICL